MQPLCTQWQAHDFKASKGAALPKQGPARHTAACLHADSELQGGASADGVAFISVGSDLQRSATDSQPPPMGACAPSEAGHVRGGQLVAHLTCPSRVSTERSVVRNIFQVLLVLLEAPAGITIPVTAVEECAKSLLRARGGALAARVAFVLVNVKIAVAVAVGKREHLGVHIHASPMKKSLQGGLPNDPLEFSVEKE